MSGQVAAQLAPRGGKSQTPALRKQQMPWQSSAGLGTPERHGSSKSLITGREADVSQNAVAEVAQLVT